MSSRMPVRYLGWMTRDVALGPGLASLAIAVLFTFIASRLPTAFTPDTARDFLVRTVGQFDWLVVLIATGGIVSNDVSKGYYRALFSQPINPGWYYLQRWLLGAVAVAALIPLIGLGLLATSSTFPFSGPLLARLLLKYLLLGGLTFALSTVLRTDWLIAFLISILQTVLHQVDQSGVPLSPFTRGLARALPPFQVATGGFGSPSYPATSELTHALLYGVALIAIGLAVLMLRPLGSGGRA